MKLGMLYLMYMYSLLSPPQVQPHRLDRMYYMTGLKLVPQQKYHVDDEELRRLRDMSRARRSSPHYGRGLR